MSKQAKRELRQQQSQALESQPEINADVGTGPVHVACVIHSTGYDWTYVERLFNSVSRNVSRAVQFHVYTEHDRSVPPHMTKHILTEWPGVQGPRKSWWYKMQLFDTQHHAGPMLYLDLDTVIVGRLDWITQLHTKFFWAPRDFRSLWRPTHSGINSSVMWFDTREFHYVWQAFATQNRDHVMRAHHGDQDFISETLDHRQLRYFDPWATQSWRWQALDGGLNFRNRTYLKPGTGTHIDYRTSILIFHGQPKPHEVTDPVIQNFWC